MLDIIYSLFNAIKDAILGLIDLIVKIPSYIAIVSNYLTLIPGALLGLIMIGFTAYIVIKLKRLLI